MDGNGITSIISTVGFPIAMSLLLFWYMTKQAEEHKAESDKLRESINGLTMIITKLYERMSKDHE